MQNTFANALSETISKHMPLSATRRETLAWLALLIMRHGTICLWRLAAHVATMATIASVRRRFYRFFQHIELDGAMTARVVADLLGMRGKPWVSGAILAREYRTSCQKSHQTGSSSFSVAVGTSDFIERIDNAC